MAKYRLMPPLHLPGVVGDPGAVSRCRIPFSAQIRSNNTSADLPALFGGEDRPVVVLTDVKLRWWS